MERLLRHGAARSSIKAELRNRTVCHAKAARPTLGKTRMRQAVMCRTFVHRPAKSLTSTACTTRLWQRDQGMRVARACASKAMRGRRALMRQLKGNNRSAKRDWNIGRERVLSLDQVPRMQEPTAAAGVQTHSYWWRAIRTTRRTAWLDADSVCR